MLVGRVTLLPVTLLSPQHTAFILEAAAAESNRSEEAGLVSNLSHVRNMRVRAARDAGQSAMTDVELVYQFGEGCEQERSTGFSARGEGLTQFSETIRCLAVRQGRPQGDFRRQAPVVEVYEGE